MSEIPDLYKKRIAPLLRTFDEMAVGSIMGDFFGGFRR